MGARKRRPFHNDKTRAKIQASQIINRLQKHIDGEVDMSASQVTAANILLKKTIPDLQATQHSGDDDAPLTVKLVNFVGNTDS